MANVFDYVVWRGDLSIRQSALNDVDCLILSQLAYINFKDVVSEKIAPDYSSALISIKDASEKLFRLRKDACKGLLMPPDITRLLKMLAKSRRYRNMRLSGYQVKQDVKKEEQFGAIVIHTGYHSAFVAFSGTDDSLVGWKEDFNMSFVCPVPSQNDAKIYLQNVARTINVPFFVGGHSKGGNLSLYASFELSDDSKKKVMAVYNFDGPGFMGKNYNCDIEFQKKLKLFIPQSSIVGVVFGRQGCKKIIKSDEVGVWQHNPFSWQIKGKSFVLVDEITWQSKLIDSVFRQWLSDVDVNKRKMLVENFYEVFNQTGATTLLELTQKVTKKVLAEAFLCLTGIEIKGKKLARK